MTSNCPICGAHGTVERQISTDEIAAGLHAVFAAPPPPDAVPHGYDLMRCGGCDLVYADPMRAGGEALYDWLTGFEKYHAHDRWEWDQIKQVLKQAPGAEARPLKLLELGAGRGDFLAEVAALSNVQASGIDLSEASAAAAKARGLDVRHAALEDVIGEEAETYDVVVLSHVLEHVGEPLDLMTNVKRLLTPGGRVLFSVPYSPMSREYLHDDVMNLPPHHMTRWNQRSLEGLAKVTGLALETWMPKAKRPWKRALKHTCDHIVGEGQVRGLARLPIVLANLGTFRRVLADHQARERVNGQMAADTVLVSLKS